MVTTAATRGCCHAPRRCAGGTSSHNRRGCESGWCFDVDRDASWYAADEAGLPAPTFTAINRQNGHGHLGYGIDTPVRLEDWNGRRGPTNYLADVERAMTARLGVDPYYRGLTNLATES